jgi:hypothetical protein
MGAAYKAFQVAAPRLAVQVGRLFHHVLSQKGTSCGQVLCISHNPALQDLCSHVVSLRPPQPKRAKR